MSKKTQRRAAERQAHLARKANCKLQLTAQAAVTAPPATEAIPEAIQSIPEPIQSITDPIESTPPEASNDGLTYPPVIRAILDRVDPDSLRHHDKFVPNTQHVEAKSSTSASAAQIAANRENAKLSHGPVTAEGKAIAAQNRRTHGLVGRFCVLPFESSANFTALAESIYAEYQPETGTEQRLVDSMIQHHWLKERAILLQEELMCKNYDAAEINAKQLNLFVRYQTTHERSYYKALKELQNLQKQKRQAEIGFERKNRQQEAHEAKVRLTHARAQNLEIDTTCRQVMEVPIPGNERISFEELTKACSTAIAAIARTKQFKTAA